ncbi:hypothetical protein BC940DRAFT_363688 [Gongronella butleri]|nr:hypothetical protein BC940DRAFT_363688 [Gongronella butleri]
MKSLPPKLVRMVLERVSVQPRDILEARLVNRAWSQIASEHLNAGGTMQIVIKRLGVNFTSILWRDYSAALLCRLVDNSQFRVMNLDVTELELRVIIPHLTTFFASDLLLVLLFLRQLLLLRDLHVVFIASDGVDGHPSRSLIYESLASKARHSISRIFSCHDTLELFLLQLSDLKDFNLQNSTFKTWESTASQCRAISSPFILTPRRRCL